MKTCKNFKKFAVKLQFSIDFVNVWKPPLSWRPRPAHTTSYAATNYKPSLEEDIDPPEIVLAAGIELSLIIIIKYYLIKWKAKIVIPGWGLSSFDYIINFSRVREILFLGPVSISASCNSRAFNTVNLLRY